MTRATTQHRAASRRRARAFTLLEVVLAMAVLALLATICYGAFWLGIRAVDKGEAAVVTAQRLRVASDVLIRQIKSAVVQAGCKRKDDEGFLYFIGEPDRLRFVTAAGQLAGGGMTQVWYTIQDDRLTLNENPAFSPDGLASDLAVDPGALRTATLLDGFTAAELCYLPPDETGGSGGKCGIRQPGFDGWVSRWDAGEEEILPRAVAIAIEGLPGFDTDLWVQQVPIMAWSLPGENTELEEDGCELCEQQGSGASATGEGGTATGTGDAFGSGTGSGGRPAAATDPAEAELESEGDE